MEGEEQVAAGTGEMEEIDDEKQAHAMEIAQEIFDKFDADDSGTIDKEEAREIFMAKLKA